MMRKASRIPNQIDIGKAMKMAHFVETWPGLIVKKVAESMWVGKTKSTKGNRLLVKIKSQSAKSAV